MATYAPPTSTLTIFNPDVFLIGGEGADFLAFPVAQGAETFPFGLTTSTATVAGALSAGTSTLTSVITDTTIGTAVGTAVSLYGEATRSGQINIGAGITAKNIYIGPINSGTTVTAIGGSEVYLGGNNTTTLQANPVGASGILNLGTNMGGGTITIGGTSGGTTTIAIGNGTAQTGAISIGTGASTKNITIGNSTSLLNTNTTLNGQLVLLRPTAGGSVGIGDTNATGFVNIGAGSGSTATALAIAIGNSDGHTGTIGIGAGTGSKTISIGNATGTTVAIAGSTITASKMAVAGTLSGAATTLTSCACNTYTGTTMTLTPVTSLAIGGTTAANSPFFNTVGGTTSINGGTATQSIDIGHGQTTGSINIGNITSRTGAINMGYSGATTGLTANATTITLGDANTTGGVAIGVPLRPNYGAGTYTFASTEVGYQTSQAPATAAIATGSPTNMTGTFTLGNGVWTIVITILSSLTSYSASCYFRMGLSKTSATFENDRIIDFNPNTSGGNYFTATFVVQSSSSQTWYVIGQQGNITTTIGNTSIRVQQTRIA